MGLDNNGQRYKVIDHGDPAEFLQEDMIDQLRGEEMTLSTFSGVMSRSWYSVRFEADRLDVEEPGM